MADDYPRIVQYFENNGNRVSTIELNEKLGFSSDKINKMVTLRHLERLERGSYALTEKFYNKFTIRFPEQQGELNLYKKTFKFGAGIANERAAELIKNSLSQLAAENHLLIEKINIFDHNYEITYAPARYSRLDNHLVFDSFAQTPDELSQRAKVAYGKKNGWMLGEYFEQLSKTQPRNFADTFKDITSLLKERYGDIGRIEKFSETYRSINPDSLRSQRPILSSAPGVYFDPKTKVHFIDEKHHKLPDSNDILKIAENSEKRGLTLKNMASFTFKRILPGIGIGISVNNIANAEDKVDQTFEEASIFGGGAAGSLLAALLVAPTGPVGIGVGIAAGLGGAGLGGYSYDALRNKNNKNSASSPDLSFDMPFTPMNKFSFSEYKNEKMTRIKESDFVTLSSGNNTRTTNAAAVINRKPLPKSILQNEKEEIIRRSQENKLTQEETEKVDQFLEKNNQPTKLSNDEIEDRAMHFQINEDMKIAEYMRGQDTRMNFQIATDFLFKISHLGGLFGNEGLQTFGFITGTGVSAAYNVLQLTGSTALGITQVTGLAAFVPAGSVFLAAASAYVFLTQAGENPNAEVMEGINIIISQMQIFMEFESYWHHRNEQTVITGFRQTYARQEVTYNAVVSLYQYVKYQVHKDIQLLQPKIDRMEIELKQLGQANLLIELRKIISIVELNQPLTDSELREVIRTLEFYLYSESSHPALTSFIENYSENDFSAENVEMHLTKDLNTQLGYLYQYQQYLLGDKKFQDVRVVNPYVYLRAYNAYITLCYRYPDHPMIGAITPEKVSTLTSPVKPALGTYQTARNTDFLKNRLLDYKNALVAVREYLLREFAAISKQNTREAIDIRGDMNELLQFYIHTSEFMPLNQSGLIVDAVVDATGTRIVRMDPPAKMDIMGARLNISDEYKYIASYSYVENDKSIALKIPSVLILADRIGEWKINVNIIGRYYMRTGAVSFMHNVNSAHENNTVIEVCKFEKTSQDDGNYCVGRIALSHGKPVSDSTALCLSEIYRLGNVRNNFNLLYKDEQLIRVKNDLVQMVYVKPRKKLGESLLFSQEFEKHLAELHKKYLTLIAFLKQSGLDYQLSDTTFITRNAVQMAVQALSQEADLSQINLLLSEEKFSAYLASYTKFMDDILNKSSNPETVSNNKMESMLIHAVDHLNTTSHYLMAKNQAKPVESQTKPLVDETCIAAVKECDDTKVAEALEETVDINAKDENKKTALDHALDCEPRERNRIIMQLVQLRAYECENPARISGVLAEVMEKGRDILSGKEYSDINKAKKRFDKFHKITQPDPIEDSFHNAGTRPNSIIGSTFGWVWKKTQSVLSTGKEFVVSGHQYASSYFSRPTVTPTNAVVHSSNQQNTNNSNYAIPFDSGDWDPIIQQHPQTGEPIFIYRVYQNGTEVGSASFYKHPLLCRSESSDRHNLFVTTGVLSQYKFETSSLEEVCAALPPTLFDTVITSAARGAKHGAIRGVSNVIGYTLQARKFPEHFAQRVQQFVYYGGYFLLRYHECFSQRQDGSWQSAITAAYEAAADTGSIFIMNAVVNQLCQTAQNLSHSAIQRGWSRTGRAIRFFGDNCPHSFFVYKAAKEGVVSAATSAAAEITTQYAIEQIGPGAPDRFFKAATITPLQTAPFVALQSLKLRR